MGWNDEALYDLHDEEPLDLPMSMALAEYEREAVRKQAREAEARRLQEWSSAREFPTEWGAWLNIKAALVTMFVFGGPDEYGFEEFRQDVGPPPPGSRTIERKDTRRPFEPGNLKWSTAREVESPYLTLDEAATYTRRRPKTLSNHVSLGQLRAMPGSRPPLFLREDLDRWMKDPRKGRRR
jgi:hypothetical protein